jgi:hypothetical protein
MANRSPATLTNHITPVLNRGGESQRGNSSTFLFQILEQSRKEARVNCATQPTTLGDYLPGLIIEIPARE